MKTKLKIGGISLPNSISFIGPKFMATINTKTDKIKYVKVTNSTIIRKIPFIRGPVMLLRQVWCFNKIWGPVVVFIASVALVAPDLVRYIPALNTAFTLDVLNWFGVGLLALEGLGLLYVVCKYRLKILEMIKNFKLNHGAEHKAIWCYNKGLDLTLSNIKSQPKEHPNCGSTIVVWFIILIVFLHKIPFYNLICMSLATEILLLADRLRLFFIPSLLLQKLTTREPSDEIINKAIKSFNTLLKLEGE